MFGLGGYPFGELVLLNTKTKQAMRGILWSQHNGFLVLRQPEIRRQGGEWAPMDGEAVIDRANVDWMQVLARGVQL